jgi:hypothetical protein
VSPVARERRDCRSEFAHAHSFCWGSQRLPEAVPTSHMGIGCCTATCESDEL